MIEDGHFSEGSEGKSGVPQGSILGPLLFDFAVKSLSSIRSLLCGVLQYADDIVVWRVVKSKEDCEAHTERLGLSFSLVRRY